MNSNEISDEILCAYLDHELSPAERDALELALAGDADAQQRLRQFREGDAALRAVFEDAGVEGPAASHVALLRTKASAGPARRHRYRPSYRQLGMALAASLAGLALFQGWKTQMAAPSLDQRLLQALEHSPSGDTRDGATMVLSFRTASGQACRQFEWRDNDRQTEGVACRGTRAQWEVKAWHVVAAAPADAGYRPAGTDSALEALIDTLDASGPLGVQEERELIAHGWR